VRAEMPPSWHPEALKAQAVAARTYASWEASTPTAWYDTCDTTQCQVFNGVADDSATGTLLTSHEDARTTTAVDATAGQILSYGGAPAFTQFSASNGGHSAAGSRPYLRAAADPFDGYAPWTVKIDARTIESKYPAIGGFVDLAVKRDGQGAFGGRTTEVVIRGGR